jgi:hypothetical protein
MECPDGSCYRQYLALIAGTLHHYKISLPAELECFREVVERGLPLDPYADAWLELDDDLPRLAPAAAPSSGGEAIAPNSPPTPPDPVSSPGEATAKLKNEETLTPDTEMLDLVTLDQAAAFVHTSKRTLERYKTEGILPEPVREGGGGKSALYAWKTMRPFLMEKFGLPLPERLPSLRKPPGSS